MDEFPASHRSASYSLCLHVALLGSSTPWRRVRVPDRMTLRRLHAVLRCVLGFPDVEAHRFRFGDVHYGNTDPAGTMRDSRWATIGELVGPRIATFRYELTAPELVVHEVRVEAVLDVGLETMAPVCLGGEGVWPERPLEPAAAPDRVAFLPSEHSAPAFDLEAVNVALARLR